MNLNVSNSFGFTCRVSLPILYINIFILYYYIIFKAATETMRQCTDEQTCHRGSCRSAQESKRKGKGALEISNQTEFYLLKQCLSQSSSCYQNTFVNCL